MMREDTKTQYIVDRQATADYADIYNAPCGCIYCRNYEKMFAAAYPGAARVLAEFGIAIGRPLEIMDDCWNDAGDKRRYESYYSVKGELFADGLVVYDSDAVITLYRPDTDAPVYSNTGMAKPWFVLVVSNIELPWGMPERPDD